MKYLTKLNDYIELHLIKIFAFIVFTIILHNMFIDYVQIKSVSVNFLIDLLLITYASYRIGYRHAENTIKDSQT